MLGLVVLGVLAVGLVAVSLWNPWRLTMLHPLARQGGAVGVLVLGGALLATAGLLRYSVTGRTAVLGLAISMVAVPALCVGLPIVAFRDSFRRDHDSRVVAVSPEGGFVAVRSTVDTREGGRTKIFVRSQDGMRSRESASPIAECASDPAAAGGPPAWEVRFTSETHLAFTIGEQDSVTVAFDPDNLRPEDVFPLCPAS